MRLAELQSVFADQLLGKCADVDALDASGPFPLDQLLQVYRNNFTLSLSDYLQACFPVTEALVGEAFFAQLAKAYVREVPLEQPSIESYGAQFSWFIAQCPQTRELEYLADIAALEWSVDRAKQTLELSGFPFAQLESLNAQQQEQLCFTLHPSVSMISSANPIVSIWQGVSKNELEGIDMSQSETALIFVDADMQVQLQSVSATQGQFLSAVKQGQLIGQLAEISDMQHHLGHYIGLGVINNFCLQSESIDD
ncbi:MAG: putative DNA-binding domain-containing protein [Pseudomonadales bacterium]